MPKSHDQVHHNMREPDSMCHIPVKPPGHMQPWGQSPGTSSWTSSSQFPFLPPSSLMFFFLCFSQVPFCPSAPIARSYFQELRSTLLGTLRRVEGSSI